MPLPQYSTLRQEVYFSSTEERNSFLEAAKAHGMALSKYIVEMARRGQESEENRPRPVAAQDLDSLREEIRKLRDENKLLSMLREKNETELFKLRNEVFLQPHGEGELDSELMDLLRSGGTHDGKEILSVLHISPADSKAMQIIYRQLTMLQSMGMVREEARGWRWIAKI